MTRISLTARSSGVELGLAWSESEPAVLTLRLPGQAVQPARPAPTQPLVEALASGHGRNWSGQRYVTTAIGQRLRYARHHTERASDWQTVWLTQLDAITGLEFTSELSIHDQHPGVRSVTHVRNAGADPVSLHAVTSLVFADFDWRDGSSIDDMTLLRGRSDWLAEGRWQETGLRESGLPRLTDAGRPFRARGCIEASSVSTWSTANELPAAVLTNTRSGQRWSFQVEHNGGWLWQVGELADGLYLALLGPTDEHHQWQLELAPGAGFDTVPASVALEPDAELTSLRALTELRRVSRPAPAHAVVPVVFNDYMNTVNGDPTAEVLHPLIDSAADAGADYFVIDAGWYADDGDWWSGVGEWQPSARRFPEGIDVVLEHVRARGMVPGLWLEPEVVGVNSPIADKLPDTAFLQRDGIRVSEHGRYHLDFTDEATVCFLDEVVDRLVNDHGIGYFKLDYNIRAGVGSDAVARSVGHGLLLHNRAYLGWLDALRRRHPQLMLENCASGGMRQDFATASRFDLQSTSDQEDFRRYAPIAAAAPMLVTPEQAANWAYPQPGMSDDEVVFTMSTAMLGRLYLSGWLNRLPDSQHRLVRAAVTAHKRLAPRMPHCVPFWPLGLPGWDDEWVALGLRDHAHGSADELYLTIWRRAHAAGSVRMALPPPPAGMHWGPPSAVYPEHSPLTVVPAESGAALDVVDEGGRYCARVVTLRAEPDQ